MMSARLLTDEAVITPVPVGNDEHTILLTHFHGGITSPTSSSLHWNFRNAAGAGDIATYAYKAPPVAGKWEFAADFGYSGDSVAVFDGPVYNLSGSDLTWDFWLFARGDGIIAQSSNGSIFPTGGCYFRIRLKNARIYCDVPSNGIYLFVSDPITLNQWHHIAINYADDTNVLHCYVDGVRSSSGYTNLGSNIAFSNNWIFGGRDLNTGEVSVDGLLDEFRISKVWRYSADFDPPSVPYGPD
jgi:hypothetical protein